MNNQVYDQDSLIPSFIDNPDMRFGTSFLSYKFRDYSVNGESIMDKATGEIFTKRPNDGKIVSFFQNKKYVNDIMSRLYLNIVSHGTDFVYPLTHKSALYFNTDYDLVTLNSEDISKVNIYNSDIILSTTDNSKLSFKLLNESNGFFARITTRDSDKAVIEWLTKKYYDNLPETVNKDFNAEIRYTLKIYWTNAEPTEVEKTASVRINDESCVIFRDGNDYSNINYYLITINSITFTKIRESFNNIINEGSEADKAMLKSLTYFDNDLNEYQALAYYLNISGFIPDSTAIPTSKSANIIGLYDYTFVEKYLINIKDMQSIGSFIIDTNKPNTDIVYTKNDAWVEPVEKYEKGNIGTLVGITHESDIEALKEHIRREKDQSEESPFWNNDVLHTLLHGRDENGEEYEILPYTDYSVVFNRPTIVSSQSENNRADFNLYKTGTVELTDTKLAAYGFNVNA